MAAVHRTPLVNFLLGAGGLTFVLSIVSPFLPLLNGFVSVGLIAISQIVFFAVVAYLFRYGGLWKSRLITPMMLLLAAGLISALFITMHWRFGHLLRNLIVIAIPALYGAWFLGKKEKTRADYAKAVWMGWFFGLWWLTEFYQSILFAYLQGAGYLLLLYTLWITHQSQIEAERVPQQHWDFEKQA